MKFTKLATSDSFNYKMLNRLQQDCKYFIEHPNLKHLWAQDIDAQIKEMLKIYTSLDPKPEWISEDEIYNYEKQMKEVYTNKKDAFRNNWMNPKFEKESANDITFKVFYINDDMEKTEYKSFVDDKKAEQCAYKLFDKFKHQEPVWVERYKGNYDDGYTLLDLDPDTYDRKPIYKSYKSGYTNGKKDYNVGKVFDVDDLESNWRYSKEWKEGYWQGVADAQEKEFYKQSAIQQPNKPKPTTMLPDNMEWAWDPDAADWVAVLKDNDNTTPPLYDPNNQNVVNQTTSYMSTVKSSCLSKFLDGPQYSKEIKIEAGLIKDGLLKYAGFDFNRGTKYAITDKGLEVLRKASEAEHNEALNEREKLAYMFGFNTDEVFTLDTTGKVIKSEEITDGQLEESWNKYYPLYRKDIEEEKMTEENYPADDEVAQKLKTTLSMYLYGLKRYRKAIPIMKYHTNAKMKRAVEHGHSKGLSEDEITKQVDDIAEEYYKKENKIKPTFNSLSEDYLKSFIFNIIKNKKSGSLNKFARKWTICEADGSELGEVEADSELNAKVKFGIEHPEYADSQSICAKEINAQYEQTTNTKEPYPNPSETPNDHIILENHDGWVNTAKLENKDTYRKLFSLAKILEEYKEKDLIYDTPSEDDDIVFVSGDAKVINELEHKLKNIGFYCEPIEQANTTFTGLVYSLKIFLK